MYAPNQLQIYQSAFIGALAGMATSSKVPSASSANNIALAVMADAYAQAVDVAWGSAQPTQADVMSIRQCSMGVWLSGVPVPANSGTAAAYATLAADVLVAVTAGRTQLASEGIVSPQQNPLLVQAGNTSGQTIPSGAFTTVTNWTKLADNYNALNAVSGIFTAPFAGLFASSAQIAWGQPLADGILNACIIAQTGSSADFLNTLNNPGAVANPTPSLPMKTYALAAGDTLKVQAFQTNGGNRTLGNAAPNGNNSWMILQVG